MKVKVGTALEAPSDEKLQWFESIYRVKLPRSFRATLCEGNGGMPMNNTFVVNGRERLIERLLCLIDEPENDPKNGWADITVVLTQVDDRLIDDKNLIGMNVIPIAAVFGGDLLCLDYRSRKTEPTVALWDHERSESFRPHLEKVADSFDEFERVLGSTT